MYLTALFKSCSKKSGFLTKTIRIMKLVTVLLIATCLQVSAKSYAQRVTLKETNISLVKVFDEIRKQTGFQFFYADEVLLPAKNVTVNVKKSPVEEVLDICLQGQGLSYTLSGNTYIIKRKVVVPEVIEIPVAPLVMVDVKGRVTNEKGQPLAGATILIKGSKIGVRSDADGNFSINADPNSVLVISYVGYDTKEVW